MPEEFATWEVTGRRPYRGHEPGSTFDAWLDTRVSARAVARGDIRRKRNARPGLRPGSYTFPRGWLEKAAESNTSRR